MVELSKREKEVVELLYTSMTYKEIAVYIFVDEKTIKFHASRIFKKLGVRNRIDLLASALVDSRRKEFKRHDPTEILDLDALPRGNR